MTVALYEGPIIRDFGVLIVSFTSIYSNKSTPIKTRHEGLLEPPFLQLLSLYHWFSNSNSDSQPSNRQHKLSFVKALAQDVKRARWRYPTPKQIEPISENQRSRLKESGRCDYLLDIRNLNGKRSTPSKIEQVPHVPRIGVK